MRSRGFHRAFDLLQRRFGGQDKRFVNLEFNKQCSDGVGGHDCFQ
jgi:hypothetical protein